jgi:outer membrane protein OmpA-like peptidoglycan-associated protein
MIGWIVKTFVAVIAAGLMGLGSVAVHAQSAPNYDDLAKSLAAKPKPEEPSCPKKLPDGSCPDTVETRQMRLPGAATATSAISNAAASVSRAVRVDISMTFLKGSADLTATAKSALDHLAKSLVAVGSYRPFTVEGHTDRSGPRDVNMALSQARAQSVVNYLSSSGVDKSKMTARGYGFDRTLKGHSPDDAANRRVEVSAS